MNSVVSAVMMLLLVMAPVKPYVKPGEPVEVRFAQSQNEQAQKMTRTLGFKALEVPELFQNAPAGEVVTADGKPLFQAYRLSNGSVTALEAKNVKVDASEGSVDIAAFYPQIRESGSYILVWKTSTPLVINTLSNPGFTRDMLDSIPEDQKAKLSKEVMAQFEPVAIHIVPLEYATISTDKGEIKATFAYDVASHTVENFISLAEQKYYDGTVFHRIIKGFMIQGGDSLGTTAERAGTGGPGYGVVQEFSKKPHVRGVLSMARSSDPDSAGGQFFIMHATKPHLNGSYTAFGQVVEGMDVVDKLAETPVTDDNGSTKPENRPMIKSIRILPATAEMYGIKK